MDAAKRRRIVLQSAAKLGFDHCGIAPAEPLPRADYVRAWLAQGRAGTMHYLHRHLDARLDLRQLLDGARSVIVAAVNYHQPEDRAGGSDRWASGLREGGGRAVLGSANEPPAADRAPLASRRADAAAPLCGRIARYAWGEDYHIVLRDRLLTLVEVLRSALTEAFHFRVCVDTAPVLERELAARAGVGWIGKNTLVLHRRLGSYFVLGEIITDLEIAPDVPVADRCGSCTACLDACPTGAFPAPYQMDASRCISYLTIEHRGPIDEELAERSDQWLFGCDVCQEVCPYNREAPSAIDPRLTARPPAPVINPCKVLNWTPADYRRHLRGRAMKRAKLDMLQRNARIVLANARRASESS